MHILITADTVGGVWSYTRELVTGLSRRGVRVTLVSFGGKPRADQSDWLGRLPGVEYFPTRFLLEWMDGAAGEMDDSAAYLLNIIRERGPELLHLSQYYYGTLDVGLPKLVVAHSDVMSWSRVVHGAEPGGSWAKWYRRLVQKGLAGADLLVAPSCWMLERIESCYGKPRRSRVIHNGRTPALFDSQTSKLNYAASAGRLWDEGKQSQLLTELSDPPLPILLAGATSLVGEDVEAFGAGEKPATNVEDVIKSQIASPTPGVHCMGELSEGGMRQLLNGAAIYIATSKYEPFGLAPLEAALSRCAIVANDIASLREVWGDAAIYFRSNDRESLSDALRLLHGSRELCLSYANRAYEHALHCYTSERMVEEYLQVYTALLERRIEAA